MKLDISALPDKLIADSHKRVRKAYDALAEKSKNDGEYDYDSVAKSAKLLAMLSSKLKSRFKPEKPVQP
jgi:hypothetical protein